MGWMGKMVGGGIGFVLGGPLGAFAGAAFGHMFDYDDDRETLLIDQTRLSRNEQGPLTFFVTTFSMLAKIAKADGRVTSAEINALRSFMIRDLRLNVESRMTAERIFHQGLSDTRPFSSFAEQFYREFKDSPELLETAIDSMLRIAVANGRLHQAKEALIAEAARIFRLSPATYKRLRERHGGLETKESYAVLGCSPNDANETIKAQYRKKVKEYHPDTIAARNLSADVMASANDRFREVQEAWEAIRKERHM